MDETAEDTEDEENRLRVSAELGAEIHPKLWSVIYMMRDWSDENGSNFYDQDLVNARQLISEVRHFEHRRIENPRDPTTTAPTSLDEPLRDRPLPQDSGRRSESVSYLIALEVWDDLRTQDFRRDHLPALLKPETTEEWILTQAAADWARNPEDGSRTLHWQTPDGRTETSLVVPPGGVLERLAVFANSLCRPYLWRPSQATMFILTDSIPYLPSIAAEITAGQKYPALRRMLLMVDLAVTPEQLARAYRIHRSRQISHARPRSMSQKHIRLAAFTANRGTKLWSTLLRDWNDRWPEHAYRIDDLQNFARDARTAQWALLNTPEPRDSTGREND